MTATIFEAKAKFSELVRRAEAGEEIVITSGRERKPVVEIKAIHPVKPQRLGFLKDLQLNIPDSFFFDPLPEEELRLWMEGGPDDPFELVRSEDREGQSGFRHAIGHKGEMKVLLDTHTVLWAGQDSPFLGPSARQILREQRDDIFVSAASAWEISTKVRLGKWPDARTLEANFLNGMERAGYFILPITAQDALRAGRLIGPHGDPFDRMIAAQALAMDIPVLSADTKLDAFGIRRIW